MKPPPRNNQMIPGRDYETRESAKPNTAPSRGPSAPARGDGPQETVCPGNHRSAPNSGIGGAE